MLKPGDSFERYLVEEPIGEGGMGAVYRAHDPKLDRRVALKVISDTSTSPDASERLLREARSAAALDHPNAVSIFDVGTVSGSPYIVMELVSGRTLRTHVGDANVDLSTKLAWLGDVAKALGAAHRRGLVHRDVKPENVMVRDDGVIKVLDFGIARRTGGGDDPQGPTALPTLTREGVKIGTPVYMAPEQVRGVTLDGRADQFAWGVVAYELLAGQLPWKGAADVLAVAASILTDDVDEAPLDAAGVSEPVKAVVRRALSKKSEARFASMEDLGRALEAAIKGEPMPASGPGPKRMEASPVSGTRSTRPAVPPQSATTARRYTSQEVREILARAIEQQESKQPDSRLGFDDLVAAAQEVGVDPEVLRAASREMRERGEVPTSLSEDEAEQQAWLLRKRRAFYRHFGFWAVFSVAFFILGLVKGSVSHTMMPSLFWAIGLGIHGVTALTARGDDIAEKQRRKRLKEQERRRRREVVDKAIEDGAQLILDAGNAFRQRISQPGGAVSVKVRVAPSERRPTSERPPTSQPPKVRIAGLDTDEDFAEREAEAEEAAETSARRAERKG